jgi:hypothetical protein
MLILAPVAARESAPSLPMIAQSMRDMTGSKRREKRAGIASCVMSESCFDFCQIGMSGLRRCLAGAGSCAWSCAW